MTLTDYLLKSFESETGINLNSDSIALQRINEAVLKAENEFLEKDVIEINIPFITADESGPKHLIMRLDKNWEESIILEEVDLINPISEGDDSEIYEELKIIEQISVPKKKKPIRKKKNQKELKEIIFEKHKRQSKGYRKRENKPKFKGFIIFGLIFIIGIILIILFLNVRPI